MKTVTSITLLATFALTGVSFAGPKLPDALITEMFAMKEGERFVVHIIASGDISGFLSNMKTGVETYKLTLDVPALSPLDTKYDIETPFSRSFQVWPMQLENKIYSRVEIELDMEASAVVGVADPSHLFVRIQREGAVVADLGTHVARVVKESEPEVPEGDAPEVEEATAAAEAEDPTIIVAPLDILPVEEPPLSEDSDGDAVRSAGNEATELDDGANDASDEELFYNLFPAPARDRGTLFNSADLDDSYQRQAVSGIRVGRFALRPSMDASYIRGSNLLLLSEDVYDDNALQIRGRIAATLLESVNELTVLYEGRYRDFERFDLQDKYTHVFDIKTGMEASPRSSFRVDNHFVHGAFESQEFDRGGEIVANTDPFYRNVTTAAFEMDVSERLGAEISGNFNRVEFLEPDSEFFSYDSSELGGGILYHLSSLSSLVGEYVHTRTRPDLTRPDADSDGHLFLLGVRGEVTPLLRGRVRAGYASQDFIDATIPQAYRGFVADVSLTRDFGEETALDFTLGRRTNPSAYEENAFYVSNYATARFGVPLAHRLRLTASAVIFDNDYPLFSAETGVQRADRAFSSAVGVAYFFSPIAYVSVDYRHDRRDSNSEQVSYRNNAVQFMAGFGFLNR